MASFRVPIPEPPGRRVSLGPFEHPRDILRFLLVVSTGTLLAALLGVLPALLWVGAGTSMVLCRVEGESLWTHLAFRLGYARRGLRSRWDRSHLHAPGGSSGDSASTLEIWVKDPFPLYGRLPEERLAEGEALLCALRPVASDILLLRVPRPWKELAGMPAGHRGRHACPHPALCAGYGGLLQEVALQSRGGRILLAWVPRGPPSRGEQGPGSGLSVRGWWPAGRGASVPLLPWLPP